MNDHHGHKHHTHNTHQSFNKAFALAISLTLVYTLAEGAYALMANSMSLLADAVHNLGDVLSLVLAWLANWLLSFPPRKRYSYGFKKTSILASLTNALILVATSALIAFESIYKFFHLTEINEPLVYTVAIIGVVINAGSSMLFLKGAHEDINIKGAFLHLVADALILIGVIVATFVISLTGWLWLDPLTSLVIVGIILWGTWGLLRDSVILVLDAIPHYIDSAGVKNYLAGLPGVKAVHHVHIWGLSTKETALTAHLVMPDKKLSDADYETISHALQQQFKISHVTLQVESGNQEEACAQSKC